MSHEFTVVVENLYQCPNGHEFTAYSISGKRYGEFMLYSINNEYRYLDMIAEKMHTADFKSMLSQTRRYFGNDDFKRRIFQQLYGPATCDPDSHGEYFSITQKPPCPTCNNGATEYLKFNGNYKEMDVECVSHNLWDMLTVEEKKERV